MDLIDELNKQRSVLIENIKAIDTLLAFYRGSRDSGQIVNSTKEIYQIPIEDGVFPITGTKEKQIMWLFKNKFTQVVKISEMKEMYKVFSGKDDRIDNTARRMKREGKLVLIKYNDNNILSYWGLPSWIEDGELMKDYEPDFDKLPDIQKKEIL